MDEQLYAIPVNDAFNADCECPVCLMYRSLEKAAVEFTLGPSYMEDDVRMVTDKVGFCDRHVSKMYAFGNRLGLALMLKTHADKMIKETESRKSQVKSKGKSLLSKGEDNECGLSKYLRETEESCFVCNRINNVFDRYIDTVFYLYSSDRDFKEKFNGSKGYCSKHMRLLLDKCFEKLPGEDAKAFSDTLVKQYLENLERVRDDLSWFIDKFDYRNQDAPWKESKDAVQRMMMKQNSVYYERGKE